MMGDSWSTKVYRTWKTVTAGGEDRDATLEFFKYVIGEAFDLATRYLQSKDQFFQDIGFIIIQSLREAKAGIINHSKTYEKDEMHVAKIETLLATLDTKLATLIKSRPPEEKVTF